MNRRTFLKSIAVATVGLPTLSTFAKAKEKQQWISLLKQMPKVGQRIVLLEFFQNDAYFLTAGERKSIQKSIVIENNVYTAKFSIMPEFVRHSNGKDNHLFYNKKMTQKHNFYEVTACPWVKYGKILYDDIVFESYDISIHYIIDENMWWIPIEDEYPKELPSLPGYIEP